MHGEAINRTKLAESGRIIMNYNILENIEGGGAGTPMQFSVEENRQQFQNILLQSPGIFIFLKGPDLIIEFVNEAVLASWNKTWDIIGKPLLTVLPELKNQHFIDTMKQVYASGEPYVGNEEKATLNKKGILVDTYYNFVYQPILDSERNVSGISITAVDITAQVLARKRAEESEARYRLLIESAEDYGMFMITPQGHLNSWNTGIKKILGYKEQEFVGQHCSLIFTDADKQKSLPQLELQTALTTGKAEVTRTYKRKDGVLFFAESVTTPIRNNDGEVVGFTTILKDLSAKKISEQQLKDAQESSDRQKRLYETVTGNTPDLMYVFDLDYKFIYANEALLTMWGKPKEEAIGKRLLENGYEPWHAEMHEREIDQVVATKQSIRGEVSFPHAVLGKRVYDYIFTPVINEKGEVEAVAGTTRDITELKRAEATLKESGERLEALVNERTKQLQRSNEDLRRFAHVASHDLKEPVRKIRTFTSRLDEEFHNDLAPQALLYLSKIEKSAERMYSMIDGVLSYSTFSSSQKKEESVDLYKLLLTIQSDLELVIAQKSAVVEVGELPKISGSPVLLYQLFYNLINNALKFSRTDPSPKIQVALSNEKEKHMLVAKESPKDSSIYLTVEDNGIGFDEEDAEKIFQIFSRLNSKDKYEGTGLGLALCKNIVERHGGAIRASGERGVGARFIIRLPASAS